MHATWAGNREKQAGMACSARHMLKAADARHQLGPANCLVGNALGFQLFNAEFLAQLIAGNGLLQYRCCRLVALLHA
ncbi:MAG: hypothetical protein RR390_20065, partial [Hafnia sp.]